MKLTVEDKNLSGVLDGAWGKLTKKSICSRPDVKLNVSVMLLNVMEMSILMILELLSCMVMLAVNRQT